MTLDEPGVRGGRARAAACRADAVPRRRRRISSGRRSTRPTLDAVAGSLAALEPPDDVEVSGTYRLRVAATLARRALPRGRRAARERGMSEHRRRASRVEVNGAWREAAVEPRRTLADFLREDLDLTGTHLACEHGFCGNCNVLLDGESVRSCLLFAVQAQGRSLETVEGLAAPDGTLGALQQAFTDNHGLQCGFCTPAMLITAQEYLRAHPGRRHRRADPRGDQRRHLPLHRLPADRRLDPRRRAGGAAA